MFVKSRSPVLCQCFFAVILCVIINFAETQKEPHRICVSGESMKTCQEMTTSVPDANIQCVSGIDKINCIEKITKDGADFVPLEPEEIYVAHRYLKDGFKVITEIRSPDFQNRDFRYEPVAVVRKSSEISSTDLAGKKSCHTGFGRNAGWKIPFSHLMDKKELPKFCDKIQAPTPEKDLYAVSSYFSAACAPGMWVPEPDKNAQLKEKYPNLCELCKDPRKCVREDAYGGYDGALRCLTMQNADIAWTKMDAVVKFFKLDSQPAPNTKDFHFLCWDGSSIPLNLNTTCSWAKRPWNAYLASNRLSVDSIKELQKSLDILRNKGVEESKTSEIIPAWITDVLQITVDDKSGRKFDVFSHIEAHTAKLTSPHSYLEKGKNYTVTIEKPSCATDGMLKMCVKSELEKNKCLAMQLAALGRRVYPKVGCVLAESNLECIQKVANGQADMVNLSPKDSTWAQRNYALTPILSEVEHSTNSDDSGPYRFALAVVKASDPESYKNISSLKGKKSCHGSVTSLAGWNVPLSKLRELKLIMAPTCGLSLEMSNFFGNQSCVPGAKGLAESSMSWLPTKKLCALCAGDGERPGSAFTPETVCADDETERYYGPAGALRCLMENVGEIAFVDHVGLFGKTLHSGIYNSTDFKLVCPNGGTTDLKNYQQCNWGKIPSNQILARGGDEYAIKREDVRLTLLKIADTLGPAGRAAGVIKLFGPYFGNNDLLFQDTSIGLCNYKSVQQYTDLISDFDYCTTSGSQYTYPYKFLIFVISLCSVFKWINHYS